MKIWFFIAIALGTASAVAVPAAAPSSEATPEDSTRTVDIVPRYNFGATCFNPSRGRFHIDVTDSSFEWAIGFFCYSIQGKSAAQGQPLSSEFFWDSRSVPAHGNTPGKRMIRMSWSNQKFGYPMVPNEEETRLCVDAMNILASGCEGIPGPIIDRAKFGGGLLVAQGRFSVSILIEGSGASDLYSQY